MANKTNDGKKKGLVDKIKSTKVGKFVFDTSLPGMTYNVIQKNKKKKADAAAAKAGKRKKNVRLSTSNTKEKKWRVFLSRFFRSIIWQELLPYQLDL